ncbi:MAG: hypothetical protein N2C14_16575 [Planctomycetales bacterium]
MFRSKFSDSGRKLMQAANRESQARDSEYIRAGHLALGLLDPEVDSEFARQLSGHEEQLRSCLESELDDAEEVSLRIIVERAMAAAKEKNHAEVEVEHVALALMESSDHFSQSLRAAGIDASQLQLALETRLASCPPSDLLSEDAVRRFPEAAPLLAELERHQQLKWEAARNHDFETAAQHHRETDRIESEIKDLMARRRNQS